MIKPQIAPLGSWRSPITTELITNSAIRLGQIALDGEDIYWSEQRQSEQGRTVVVRRTADGQTQDVIAAPFNVRTRVHEYGGGFFLVVDGTVYFSNVADGRLYRQDTGKSPIAATYLRYRVLHDLFFPQDRSASLTARQTISAPVRAFGLEPIPSPDFSRDVEREE